MGIISVIIIFICICVDNMVSANMTAMNITKDKGVFSLKVALFFSGFNMLFFVLGYLVSLLFFHNWVYAAHNWVAFAFLLLLGIKFTLESIEKSPSFYTVDTGATGKLIKVAALLAMNAFLVGYAAETMDTAWFPQWIFLALITFGMTLIGFRLGGPNAKTVISKKLELLAGLILIVMAVRLIII